MDVRNKICLQKLVVLFYIISIQPESIIENKIHFTRVTKI